MSGRSSFRLRFALLAALASGSVLTVSGILLWNHLARFESQRIDRNLAGVAHRRMGLLPHRPGDHGTLPPRRAPAPPLPHERSQEYQYWALRKGRTLVQSAGWPQEIDKDILPLPTAAAPGDPGPATGRRHRPPVTTTVAAGGRSWRICTLFSPESTLHVALDLADHHAQLRRIAATIIATLSGALVVSALAGWWLSGRALAPVRAIANLAEAIGTEDLSRRLPQVARDRELQHLIDVVNAMLARLEKGFSQAARFSADASHELRTPLAVMQGNVETAIGQAPEGSPTQQALARQLEEIHRLKSIVDALLILARADRGALLRRPTPVAVDKLLTQVLEDLEVLHPDLVFSRQQDQGPHLVAGDRELLERVLRNLAGNAAKYNHPAGRVEVTLARAGAEVHIGIANTGPPIPAEARSRIFDRFYRADQSRSRRTDGVGLGLSLAGEITRAHGGRLELERSDREITLFLLTLPAHTGD